MNQQVVIGGYFRRPTGFSIRAHPVSPFINDLPDHVMSEIRLFANDCLIYRHIYSLADSFGMQQDLCSIGQWARD